MNYNDEEFLDFFNRLFERLHQADLDNHGSKIEFVYVASGGQHVDKVERQYIGSPSPDPSSVRASPPDPSFLSRARLPVAFPVREGSAKGVESREGYREGKEGVEEMPEALRTEAAMALWEKVREAGYVDEDYQPLLSRSQSALLADAMAERLGIKEKWKVFETLWQRRNMYRDYHDALNQRQSLQFRDQLKGLFR